MSHGHISIANDIPEEDKPLLCGLYLSMYDKAGLKRLGFDSFKEAYSAIGFGLGRNPASIKNYRDEFDPLFKNGRKGWYQKTRDHIRAVKTQYEGLDIEEFTRLVTSFFSDNKDTESGAIPQDSSAFDGASFAQRLITGRAAENYFKSKRETIPEFKDYYLEDTTSLGCGYDFRLRAEPEDKNFLAVEVKGLRDQHGSLSMTAKEYRVAEDLADRFFLFVVRNFRGEPSHDIFQNPLAGSLTFKKLETPVIQVSWSTSI